jgi:hypothetical protein
MSISLRSRFRRCLLGGAVGDALGAGIEFLSLAESGPLGQGLSQRARSRYPAA